MDVWPYFVNSKKKDREKQDIKRIIREIDESQETFEEAPKMDMQEEEEEVDFRGASASLGGPKSITSPTQAPEETIFL